MNLILIDFEANYKLLDLFAFLKKTSKLEFNCSLPREV